MSDKNSEGNIKAKDKRIIIRGFLLLAAVFAVLFALLQLFRWILTPDEQDKVDVFTASRDDISYYSADYDEKLEDDEYYMSLESRVWFTDMHGVSSYLDEGDGKSNDYVRALMYNYFAAVKNGDAEAHAALLSDHYKQNYQVQEKFTVQKLYDIEVSFEQTEKRDGVYYQYYRVFYKIYKNNGTFRPDISSDTPRDMSFELVFDDNGYKINAIGYRTIKGENYNDTTE